MGGLSGGLYVPPPGSREVTLPERSAADEWLCRVLARIRASGWAPGGWVAEGGALSLPAAVTLVVCRSSRGKQHLTQGGARVGRSALGQATEPGPWRSLGEAAPRWVVARLTRWEEAPGRSQAEVEALVLRARRLLAEKAFAVPTDGR